MLGLPPRGGSLKIVQVTMKHDPFLDPFLKVILPLLDKDPYVSTELIPLKQEVFTFFGLITT